MEYLTSALYDAGLVGMKATAHIGYQSKSDGSKVLGVMVEENEKDEIV